LMQSIGTMKIRILLDSKQRLPRIVCSTCSGVCSGELSLWFGKWAVA
jgi:hypothetical protein